MSWGMGAGSTVGGDDEDLVDVGGDRAGAAALGDPALQQSGAGLDADDAVRPRLGLGLEPHPVADHHAGGVPLRLAPEDGPDLSPAPPYVDPSRSKTVPTGTPFKRLHSHYVPVLPAHRSRFVFPAHGRHQLSGAWDMASSSAALTS